MQQRAGIGKIAPGAEGEGDLALLAVGQVQFDLHGQAWIEPRADAAGKARASHAGGPGQIAVAADELETIAADGANAFAAVEKGDAFGELVAVGVAREQAAATWIDLGDDVGQVDGAVGAEYQLEEARDRQAPRPAR